MKNTTVKKHKLDYFIYLNTLGGLQKERWYISTIYLTTGGCLSCLAAYSKIYGDTRVGNDKWRQLLALCSDWQ